MYFLIMGCPACGANSKAYGPFKTLEALHKWAERKGGSGEYHWWKAHKPK